MRLRNWFRRERILRLEDWEIELLERTLAENPGAAGVSWITDATGSVRDVLPLALKIQEPPQ